MYFFNLTAKILLTCVYFIYFYAVRCLHAIIRTVGRCDELHLVRVLLDEARDHVHLLEGELHRVEELRRAWHVRRPELLVPPISLI